MRFQYVIKYEKNLELRAKKMGDFECPCRGQTPSKNFSTCLGFAAPKSQQKTGRDNVADCIHSRIEIESPVRQHCTSENALEISSRGLRLTLSLEKLYKFEARGMS